MAQQPAPSPPQQIDLISSDQARNILTNAPVQDFIPAMRRILVSALQQIEDQRNTLTVVTQGAYAMAHELKQWREFMAGRGAAPAAPGQAQAAAPPQGQAAAPPQGQAAAPPPAPAQQPPPRVPLPTAPAPMRGGGGPPSASLPPIGSPGGNRRGMDGRTMTDEEEAVERQVDDAIWLKEQEDRKSAG